MSDLTEYLVTDPGLADYCIMTYRVTKDNSVVNSGKWPLFTEDLTDYEIAGDRVMVTDVDVAFTMFDRATDYGELVDDEKMIILYQAFNTDNKKIIRFWRENKLWINGIDYTLNPQGYPVAKNY